MGKGKKNGRKGEEKRDPPPLRIGRERERRQFVPPPPLWCVRAKKCVLFPPSPPFLPVPPWQPPHYVSCFCGLKWAPPSPSLFCSLRERFGKDIFLPPMQSFAEDMTARWEIICPCTVCSLEFPLFIAPHLGTNRGINIYCLEHLIILPLPPPLSIRFPISSLGIKRGREKRILLLPLSLPPPASFCFRLHRLLLLLLVTVVVLPPWIGGSWSLGAHISCPLLPSSASSSFSSESDRRCYWQLGKEGGSEEEEERRLLLLLYDYCFSLPNPRECPCPAWPPSDSVFRKRKKH